MTPQRIWNASTHKVDDEARDNSVPRRVRLQPVLVWQCRAIEALCLHASVESDICDSNREPAHKTRYGGHVDEPRRRGQYSCAGTAGGT